MGFVRGFGGLLLAFSLFSCSPNSPTPQNGILDLTGWDFAAHPEVRLDGLWSFVWESDGGSKPSIWKKLPGFWNQTEPTYASEGKASYHLQLLLPENQLWWSLQVPEVATSSRVSIDGMVLLETGVVSLHAAQQVPRVQVRQVSFQRRAKVTEITLEAANFHDRTAGLIDSLRIGPKVPMDVSWSLQRAQSAFLSGGLLVMGILNLFVFFFQSQRRGILWFSILSFIISLQSLVTGPSLLQDFFPTMSFELVTALKYLTVLGSAASFVLYLKQVFPNWWPPQFFLGFLMYTLLFAVLLLFLPIKVFSQAFVTLYTAPLVLVMLSCFGIFGWAVLKRHEEGTLLFPGIVLLMLGAVNDNMSGLFTLPWGLVLPQCMFLFMLYNSWLVSRQMLITYRLSRSQSLELQEIDKMKDDFLARVTHELLTPLHGMIGILDAFRMGDFGTLKERQTYHLSLLESSSKRLLSMVNSILDFSQLKHGKLVGESKPVFLKEMVDFLIPSFYHDLHPGVVMLNRIPPQVPPVLGDDAKMEQVIHHLLSNAAQHTTTGAITVDGEQQDQKVELTIRDTGAGIAPEVQKTLFTPFQQAEDADTRPKNGLGLGLAISYQLIQQMGGQLTVESVVGGGTTVKLTLPVCPPVKLQYFLARRKDRELRFENSAANWEPHEQPQERIASSQPEESRPVVLIVDDEPVNLLVLKTFLVRLNYEVVEAAGGQAALEVLDHKIIDLVILDIMMPGMSGYEVSRKIRERFSPARLPIILLTAKNQMDDLILGFGNGASDFLTKPFVREELKARMEFHLSLSHSARSGIVINKS